MHNNGHHKEHGVAPDRRSHAKGETTQAAPVRYPGAATAWLQLTVYRRMAPQRGAGGTWDPKSKA